MKPLVQCECGSTGYEEHAGLLAEDFSKFCLIFLLPWNCRCFKRRTRNSKHQKRKFAPRSEFPIPL